MSKSYSNTIDLFANKKVLKKRGLTIVKDSTHLEEAKDYTSCNVYKLCGLFMTDDELLNLQKRYLTPGEGYGHFKLALLDKINEHFAPYVSKREYYINNPKEVKEILANGARKAGKIAQEKIKEIKDAVGLNY